MDALKRLRLGVVTQIRKFGTFLFYLYLPIVVLMLGVGLLSRVSDNFTLALLVGDPVMSGRLPIGAGIISQCELVLWSASMTVCALGWMALGGRPGELARARQFLLHFGIITAVMFLDKMFMFHGDIAPKQLQLNKSIVIASYVAMMIALVSLNRKEILSGEYIFLILALVLFGLSVLMDALPLEALAVPQFGLQVSFFIEDGSKFAGVATWLAYLWRYTIQRIRLVHGSAGDEKKV